MKWRFIQDIILKNIYKKTGLTGEELVIKLDVSLDLLDFVINGNKKYNNRYCFKTI